MPRLEPRQKDGMNSSGSVAMLLNEAGFEIGPPLGVNTTLYVITNTG